MSGPVINKGRRAKKTLEINIIIPDPFPRERVGSGAETIRPCVTGLCRPLPEIELSVFSFSRRLEGCQWPAMEATA